MRGMYTLNDYDTHCCLKDVYDAHEALDLMDENDAWGRMSEEEKALIKAKRAKFERDNE